MHILLKAPLIALIVIFSVNNSFGLLLSVDKKINRHARYFEVVLSQTSLKTDTGKKNTKAVQDTVKQKNIILNGVTVKGRKVLITQNVDRSIVTVENNQLFVGSNLEEVLEKIPGVTIDGNNKLIINGNGSVKFQINGRDISVSGNSITSFIKSIQSSAIKSIEIINPSAKTDAQSSAKILNIITTQTVTDGYTINPGVTYSQGQYGRTGVNLFSQLKIKKFSFQLLSFADLSNEFSKETSSRIYQDGLNLLNNSKELNKKKSYFSKFDINYTINNRNVLGVSFYQTNSHQNSTTSSNFDVTNNAVTDSTQLNSSLAKEKQAYSIYSGYYKHTFEDNNEFITFNVDVNEASNNQNYFFTNQLLYSIQTSGRPIQDQITQTNSTVWVPSAYINYSKPLLKNSSRLDIGAKFTSIKDNESYNTQNVLNDGYAYKESITAGYASFLYDKKSFSFQAGVRGENTNTGGEVNSISVTDKNYFNLFPSISIQRKFHNDDFVFSISYRKRIIRPSFLALSPFLYFTSPYEASRGDATLSPTLINDYSTSITIAGLYINANYSDMHNVITQLPIIDASLTTVINQYSNVSKEHYRSINVSYPFTVKILTITPSVNAESASNYLTVNSGNIQKNTSDVSFNLNGVFRYNKTTRFELRTFYVPKFETISSTIDHKSGVTVRYIKTFLKGALSMRAAVEDVFNTNKESGSNNLAGYVGTFSNFYDNRRASISLTYSLRKGQRVNITAPGQDNSDNNDRIKN